MLNAKRRLYAAVVLITGVGSQVGHAQGRLEIDVHMSTGNNIAISDGETTAGESDAKGVLASHDGSAYAGSVIVDVSICKDHATLVNITKDNIAIGGTVAGSIVMTDAGIEGMYSGKSSSKSKGK